MKPSGLRVLVADDEPAITSLLCKVLGDEGCEVTVATDGPGALAAADRCVPHLALLDLMMPGRTGLEVMRDLLGRQPALRVIIMTAYATAETAVNAMKVGALDYLIKPFALDELKAQVRRVGAELGLESENRVLRRELARHDPAPEPVGRHPDFLAALDLVRRVASGDVTVLITGETGSGKEVVARFLHRQSRRPGPFLAVNCGALTESLLERELFGHDRGAFTGAEGGAPGLLEAAGDGTIFLDEIGEMSPGLQVKLLRVLEGQEFRRVGGTRALVTRARFVAATNKDLPSEVRAGRFRQDLWYRLNVMTVILPPLRERGRDAIELAEHFIARLAANRGRVPVPLAADARESIMAYGWPGNARELRNVLERALLLGGGATLEAADLRLESVPAGGTRAVWDGLPIKKAREVFECEYLLRALAAHGGNVTQTAEHIGLDRKNLEDKIRRYGLKD